MRHTADITCEIDSTQFSRVAELMPDAVALFDNKGRLCFANNNFSELFGYSIDELMGTDVESLMPPEYRKSHQKQREAYINNPYHRGMGGVQCAGMKKNGEVMPLDVLLHPIKEDHNVSVLCVARVLTDYTQKLAGLESRISVKNMELEELKKLFYKTGHDLKAPTDALSALLPFLKDEQNAGKREEILEMMEKTVKRMRRSVLKLQEIETVLNVKKQSEIIHLKSFFEDVIDYTVRKEFKNQIMLETPEIDIQSDPDLLFTIIQNLLDNAVKYSDHKNKKVQINAHHEDQELRISISDNGSGMKKEELGRIFDMFYRAGTLENGSGIGLYISQKAAETLGGKITVTSDYGKGSTFTLVLPNTLDH